MRAAAAASASRAASLAMPRIMYGTAWKAERTADLVAQALGVGYRGVDTACQPKHYNEPGVGQGVARFLAAAANSNPPVARGDLFLQTKFTPIDGQDRRKPLPYDPQASLTDQVKQSFSTSQKNLGTDYIDSLVLHSPLARKEDLLQVWRAMESLHSVSGPGVRQIGISNCYQPELFRWLYENAKVKPTVLQNRFYRESGFDIELRRFCSENNVRYQSFWTLTANPDILASDVVMNIAKEKKVTPEQVFFRVLSYMGITPLTGTKSEKHMRQDLEIFNFELDQEERKSVEDLIRNQAGR